MCGIVGFISPKREDNTVEKYLDSSKMDDEIFDLEEIEKIKRELFLGDHTNVSKVWFIIMYEMWKEKWF